MEFHGGKDFSNVMTRRFCTIKSYQLEFPLKHPLTLIPDRLYEHRVGNIILYPLTYRIEIFILKTIRRFFRIPENISTKQAIRNLFIKKG